MNYIWFKTVWKIDWAFTLKTALFECLVSVFICLIFLNQCFAEEDSSPLDWVYVRWSWIRADGKQVLKIKNTGKEYVTGLFDVDGKQIKVFSKGDNKSKPSNIVPDCEMKQFVEIRDGEIDKGNYVRTRMERYQKLDSRGRPSGPWKTKMVQLAERLWLGDLSAKGANKLLGDSTGDYVQPSFSDDGSKIVCGLFQETKFHIAVIDISTNKMTRFGFSKKRNTPFLYSDPCLTPDNQTVFFTSSDGSSKSYIAVAKVGDKKASVFLKNKKKAYKKPDVSPDGKKIVFVVSAREGSGKYHQGDELWISDIEGKSPRCLLKPKKGESFGEPVYSKDGKLIYFTTEILSKRGMVESVNLCSMPKAGGERKELIKDVDTLLRTVRRN